MVVALQDIGLAGKVKFVGFDASAVLIAGIRAHQLDGVGVQNPMRMGYLGVKTMADHLRGKPVARLIDTGVALVTAANLDSTSSQEHANPLIACYLTEHGASAVFRTSLSGSARPW